MFFSHRICLQNGKFGKLKGAPNLWWDVATVFWFLYQILRWGHPEIEWGYCIRLDCTCACSLKEIIRLSSVNLSDGSFTLHGTGTGKRWVAILRYVQGQWWGTIVFYCSHPGPFPGLVQCERAMSSFTGINVIFMPKKQRKCWEQRKFYVIGVWQPYIQFHLKWLYLLFYTNRDRCTHLILDKQLFGLQHHKLNIIWASVKDNTWPTMYIQQLIKNIN